MKLPGLSGFTVSKNHSSLDYCLRECVDSMLPICDEVVIGEMGSDDGSATDIAKWAAEEPKIRVVPITDWTTAKGSPFWFVNALNETRRHVRRQMALQLDADEVLGDDHATLSVIQKCVEMRGAIAIDRLNFARSPRLLIPEGECVGKYVVRVGPSHLPWVSDEPHQRGEVQLLDMARLEPTAKIFHLGFLRRRQAFFDKARVVLGAFFNEFDKRLADAESAGDEPLSRFPWWNRLEPYDGYHPSRVTAWLRERGYEI